MADPSLRSVAVAACEAAGAEALDRFRQGRIAGDYGSDDVTAVVDRAAEERMLGVIRETVPHHTVRTEESGVHRPAGGGTDGVAWVLDPLDGTNNLAAGLPVFASAAAVRRDGETELAVVHEPLPDDTYVATRDAGATVNGEPVTAASELEPAQATVSLVTGLSAVRNEDLAGRARAIRTRLEVTCKRVISTWAPCVDWGLLSRGGIEAVVAFHPDPWEHHAGVLLAREAGAVRRGSAPLDINAVDRPTAAALETALADL